MARRFERDFNGSEGVSRAFSRSDGVISEAAGK
jgi:hypothetical protein